MTTNSTSENGVVCCESLTLFSPIYRCAFFLSASRWASAFGMHTV
jgi:hypothetical protein